MRKLGLNTIILSGSSLLTQGITAVMYLLVARSLGPADFGIVSAALGIAMMLSTALDFGINSLTIRELARKPGEDGPFYETLSAKVVTATLLGGGWIAVTLAMGLLDRKWWLLVPLGLYIIFTDFANTFNVVAKSRERMQVVAATDFVAKLSAFVMVILLIWFEWVNLGMLPVALAVGALTSSILAYCLLDVSGFHVPRASLMAVLTLWRASSGFGLSSLAAQLQRLDVAIVGAVAGPVAAGIYAAPARITNTLTVVPAALSSALFPRISSASDRTRARQEAFRAIGISSSLTIVGLVLVASFAAYLVKLLIGSEYLGSVPVLRVLLIGIGIMSANAPLAALAQAEGKEVLVAVVIGMGTTIGLSLMALGAMRSGAVGASGGYVIMQGIILFGLIAALGEQPKGRVRKFLGAHVYRLRSADLINKFEGARCK